MGHKMRHERALFNAVVRSMRSVHLRGGGGTLLRDLTEKEEAAVADILRGPKGVLKEKLKTTYLDKFAGLHNNLDTLNINGETGGWLHGMIISCWMALLTRYSVHNTDERSLPSCFLSTLWNQVQNVRSADTAGEVVDLSADTAGEVVDLSADTAGEVVDLSAEVLKKKRNDFTRFNDSLDPPERLWNWNTLEKPTPAVSRLFIPVHIDKNHWCLAVANLEEETIEYYDSLHPLEKRNKRNEREQMQNVLDWLKEKMEEELLKDKGRIMHQPNWDWTFTSQDMAVQPNGIDCGVYVCLAAAYLLHGMDPKTISTETVKMGKIPISTEILKMRKVMTLHIVKGSVDPKTFSGKRITDTPGSRKEDVDSEEYSEYDSDAAGQESAATSGKGKGKARLQPPRSSLALGRPLGLGRTQ